MNRPTLSLLWAVFVMTSVVPAHAELIAYEGFDYTEVGDDIFRKDGGIGFQAGWSSFYGEATVLDVADGSLSFGGLQTRGNRYASGSKSGTGLSRKLVSPVSSDETATKYLSFLLRPELTPTFWDGVALLGSGTDVFVGNPGATARWEYVIENFGGDGGPDQFNTGMPIQSGQTALLVVKAELKPGIDTFTLYVNPIPGLPEPPTGTVKNDIDIRDLTGIAFGGSALFSGDEIRWGDTFADVVPAPPVSKVELIGSNEPWSFFPGTEEPSPFPELAWTTPEFDDSKWAVHHEGLGYGPDPETRGVVTVLDDMKDTYRGIYLRHSFEAPNPEVVSDLVLQVDFDDGFIAYVNGVEVVRSNVNVRTTGRPEPFEPRSIPSRLGSGVGNFLIELESFPELLRSGNDNVLAIQGVNSPVSDQEFVLSQITLSALTPMLQAGDADQDLDFDQLDLVQVQIAGRYLSGEAATWGEGDWNGAPSGFAGRPPEGDGVFNQLDIVAAQQAAIYLTGPYAGVQAIPFVPVPEPNGFLLLGLGLIALAFLRSGVGIVA